MSSIFVILVLKTVIYKGKLLGFQNIESLNREHSELSTDFMDRLSLESVHNVHFHRLPPGRQVVLLFRILCLPTLTAFTLKKGTLGWNALLAKPGISLKI